MSENEMQQQIDAMRALDEPMPQVGIFWFDLADHTSFTYQCIKTKRSFNHV